MKYYIGSMILGFALNASAIEITNFKSGLMCGINKDDMGWVCFEQEDILVTGQSSCVAKGKVEKCTWYGFSFDYKKAKPTDIIKCKYRSSIAITLLDKVSVIEENITEGAFELSVNSEEGRFINPMYTLLYIANEKYRSSLVVTECRVDGELVFEYRFKKILPIR